MAHKYTRMQCVDRRIVDHLRSKCPVGSREEAAELNSNIKELFSRELYSGIAGDTTTPTFDEHLRKNSQEVTER